MCPLALRAILPIVLIACVSACDTRQAEAPSIRPDSTTVSDIGSMYFSRAARFDWMSEQVVAIDPNAPRIITMDPWPELVFQMADGQHTVDQLRAYLSAEYEKGAPSGLNEQVISIVRELERERLIRLHGAPVALPFYLEKPVAEQDTVEARKAMERDGFGGQPDM